MDVLSPIQDLVIGVLSSALVTIADRRDHAIAARAAALSEQLSTPTSRIRQALQRSLATAHIPPPLNAALRDLHADDLVVSGIVEAFASASPRSSALTTALFDALRQAIGPRLSDSNTLEVLVRELVNALAGAVLHDPTLAPLWLNARLDAIELAILGQHATLTTLTHSVVAAVRSTESLPATAESNKRSVFLSPLPKQHSVFVGRQPDLAWLSRTWARGSHRIVSLTGWGGVGKSALVHAWLTDLAQHDFRGAEQVFAWSFYSQGSRPGIGASGDAFFSAAAQFFALDHPPQASSWQLLAPLLSAVRARRTLLILDGLEPLQHATGPQRGELRDKALRALLVDLLWDFDGLCVITSRLPLSDFTGVAREPAHKERPLDALDAGDSRDLLTALSISGTPAAIRDAIRYVHGHALSLVLLASYVSRFRGGRLRAPDVRRLLTGGTALRVAADRMCAAYHSMLQREGLDLERQMLRLLGLFDRPASMDAVRALLQRGGIPRVSDALARATEDQVRQTLQNLAEWRLLTLPLVSWEQADIDMHPLIREYSATRLAEEEPVGWRDGNLRLYKHLCQSVPRYPESLAEMEQLYRAVAHGCQAGRHQQVLDDVMYPRLRRYNEGYCTRRLGMFGADLRALTHFLGDNWDRPLPGLKSAEAPYLLNEAGIALQAIGRVQEAIKPLQRSLQLLKTSSRWKLAAIRSGNLTELYTALGDLRRARAIATEGCELARVSKDARQIIVKLTRLGNVLRLQGHLADAEAAFQEADAVERTSGGGGALWGREAALYAELMLDRGRHALVEGNMHRALPMTSTTASQLGMAHCLLCLGRASLGVGNVNRARAFLQAGQRQFESSGFAQFRPMPLLALADLDAEVARRAQQQNEMDVADSLLGSAWRHLDECLQCCQSSDLRLFELDASVLASKVQRMRGNSKTALRLAKMALRGIADVGYGLREAEANVVAAEASIALGHASVTNDYLEAASQAAGSRGQYHCQRAIRQIRRKLLRT